VQRWWREPSCPAAARTGPADRVRRRRGRAVHGGAARSLPVGALLIAGALLAGACGGGGGAGAWRRTATAQVLAAWTAGEQTVYRYDREPWPAIRQRLLAGTPIEEVFPALPRYFTNPVLEEVETSVADIKLDRLNGAKVDRLGHPRVVLLKKSIAVVESCGYDSGTTTSTGQPGPAALDGGPGYGLGKWVMVKTSSGWKIKAGEARPVNKC
jgi:hypothetical protein